MPSSGENIRFQILVNGEVRGTAGMESIGVLSLTLSWVRRDPTAMPEELASDPEFSVEQWIGNEVDVHLSGLDSAAREHVEWFGSELRPGDEVTVRVLAPGEFDAPASRKCESEGG
jgi:hypothetical protein